MSEKIEYKYNEDEYIAQLIEYVNKTYDQHYSQNQYQATEFIIDGGHGEKQGHNRADLMKVLHYALFALYVHDLEVDKRAAL